MDKLTKAGYLVTVQQYPILYNVDKTPPVLNEITPVAQQFNATGGGPLNAAADIASLTFTASGSFTGVAVQPVGHTVIPALSTSDHPSGCVASDFAGFIPGNIALIQRGTCTFATKAQNAQAAGASGVIIFNDGLPSRTGVVGGTLTTPQTIAVMATSFAVGQQLYNQAIA